VSVSSSTIVTKPKTVKVVAKSAPMKPASVVPEKKLQSAPSRARKPVASPSSIPKVQPKAPVSQLKILQDNLEEEKNKNDHLGKERNFFYEKLRAVELICQDKPEENAELKKIILDILYKVDENSEFQSPVEDDIVPSTTNQVNGHDQPDDTAQPQENVPAEGLDESF